MEYEADLEDNDEITLSISTPSEVIYLNHSCGFPLSHQQFVNLLGKICILDPHYSLHAYKTAPEVGLLSPLSSHPNFKIWQALDSD